MIKIISDENRRRAGEKDKAWAIMIWLRLGSLLFCFITIVMFAWTIPAYQNATHYSYDSIDLFDIMALSGVSLYHNAAISALYVSF
jgi:hypothetical protein